MQVMTCPRRIHRRWLRVAAVVIAGFAPCLFLGTMPAFAEPARLGLDILTWPVDGFPSYASGEIRFLSALTGGFLLGWGCTLWCLSTWVYPLAPDAVRRAVVTGACAWFVLDSAGSITSGHAANAAINVAVLLLVVGPMWLPAREDCAT
ncbi:MAG: hypothetical protein H6993_07240 [Pseudomonadales bacterium]|nr:hypothetical protein [Pseudomonadales bacterium]MCP5183740.1 hypothetical protein [Pseudomonadales bacterium]